MPVPLYARWWVITLAIVGVLLGISALALDRPNVVWSAESPHCPRCRQEVAWFAERCGQCESDFDWVVAPDDATPISPWSLGEEEFRHLGTLRERWGREAAAARVAERVQVSDEAAARWLTAAAPGRCGLCGGTGEDLAAAAGDAAPPCEVCFGSGTCIACSGDRRMRLGDPGAHRGLEQHRRTAQALARAHIPAAQREAGLRRLAEEFLRRYAGTVEAARLPFWRLASERAGRGQDWEGAPTAVEVARRRIDEVLDALEETPSER